MREIEKHPTAQLVLKYQKMSNIFRSKSSQAQRIKELEVKPTIFDLQSKLFMQSILSQFFMF